MPTNYHLLDTVQLPRGLVWVDEFNWQPVEASAEYTLTGALIYDAATRQAGRPITLEGSDDAGWMRRDTLQSVQSMAQAPGGIYLLTLADGRAYTVAFAPDAAIAARPISRPELPASDHPYVATLRLITV